MKTKLLLSLALWVLSSALADAALSTTFTNPAPAISDLFGNAVAAVGTDKVLIGAYFDDTGATDAGAAYLFSINGTLLTTFTNPTPAVSDFFGCSVAAVGDKVLIGAYRDGTGATYAGAAYLFSTNGTLLTTFTNPTPATADFFGYAVAAVGADKVLIGAYLDDTGATVAGAAYLFSTNGTLLTTFTKPTPAASDSFGYAVAAVGTDKVLIGAYLDKTGATFAGAAYLFSTNGTFLTAFTNPTPAVTDFFGYSVAAVGTDKVLIGAINDDTGATDAGAAYLFSTNGTLLTTFTKPTPAAFDSFGYAVAAVGTDKVLIGAQFDDTGAEDAGAAFLFSTNGTLLTTFTNPTPAYGDSFGYSVAAVGTNMVLIGAYSDNTGAANAGAAYLFGIEPPSVTTLPASAIGCATATLNGTVKPNGSQTTAWFEWGTTTNYASRTVSANVGSGIEAVNITSAIWGLPDGVTYHYRAVGSNSVGVSRGADQTFATLQRYPPCVATLPTTEVWSDHALLKGSASPNGSDSAAWFEWGTTTAYGNRTAATYIGSSFNVLATGSEIMGLTAGLTYHYRAVGSNSAGLAWGTDRNFDTARFVVTTLADSGAGSLRQAINDAAPGNTIAFAIAGTITLTSGELVINKNLNLIGLGVARLAISGNHSNRVFTINSNVTACISGLAIRDGATANGTNGTNYASGGGIYNAGTLTLEGCLVTNNATGNGGSGSNGYGSNGGGSGHGGSIYNSGTLTLNGCTVSGNTTGSGGSGGTGVSHGIFNPGAGGPGGNGGSSGSGGGICNLGTLTLNNCTISGNAIGFGGAGGHGGSGSPGYGSGRGGAGCPSGSGGGIYSSGVFKLSSCTVSGNTINSGGVGGDGGGTFGSYGAGGAGGGGGGGGGLFCQGYEATPDLICSTVSSNTAGSGGFGGMGGGIPPTYGPDGPNGSGGGVNVYEYGYDARLFSALIARNTGGDSPDVYGWFSSQGHNLVGKGDGSGGLTNGINGDLVGTVAVPLDPILGQLSNNGGPTWTHALLPGSPAIDAGSPFGVPPTDQRGLRRVVCGRADIGAFEVQDCATFELPLITAMTVAAGANCWLQCNGTPDASYTLQASTNLLDWLDITRLAAGPIGVFDYTESPLPQSPQRFYRLRWP
jgi:hypothetical protein